MSLRATLCHARSIVLIVSLVCVFSALVCPTLAASPFPRHGTRVVDGNTSDWNLTLDLYGPMYRAGDPTKPIDSYAYMRYDCNTNTVYVLTLTVLPVVASYNNPDSTGVEIAWIAINTGTNKVVNESSGNDGTPPDFAWVGLGFDGDPTHARGWEASFILAPGTYEIIAHLQVIDASGNQTSAFIGFPKDGLPLELDCLVPVMQSSWGKIKALYR